MEAAISDSLTLRFSSGENDKGARHDQPDNRDVILDLIDHPDGLEEAAMVEQVVAGHWAKLEQRTAGSSDKNHLILNEYATIPPFAAIALPPVFHTVRAIPETSTDPLPFSTVAFLDKSDLPHIFMAHHVDYRAIIISAFNSCLDIINLRHLKSGQDVSNPKNLVFSGLNSRPVSIIHEGESLPGFLRTANPTYVV